MEFQDQTEKGGGSGAVVQAAWLESRRSRARTPLWPSRLKKKNVSSQITRENAILWGAAVTER